MSQNLHHVRALIGAALVARVEEITRDFNQQTEIISSSLPGDTRKLRGIPAIGRGVSGHPTDSVIPGSDEHLEELSALG